MDTSTDLQRTEPLLELSRVPRIDPPDLPEDLHEWLIGPFDDIVVTVTRTRTEGPAH